MSGERITMQDQPWHNLKVDKEVVEAPKEVEVSDESPAEVVKPTVKKKTRRTKAQMKAAKDENVQATD